ncbi:hypothetical protein B0H19DRAFT_482984, partial [Mycena capillaripes]
MSHTSDYRQSGLHYGRCFYSQSRLQAETEFFVVNKGGCYYLSCFNKNHAEEETLWHFLSDGDSPNAKHRCALKFRRPSSRHRAARFPDAVWSKFEISDLDFWRGEAYMKFFENLDSKGVRSAHALDRDRCGALCTQGSNRDSP